MKMHAIWYVVYAAFTTDGQHIVVDADVEIFNTYARHLSTHKETIFIGPNVDCWIAWCGLQPSWVILVKEAIHVSL